MLRVSTDQLRKLGVKDWLLLGFASGSWTLSVLARNLVGFPHVERLIGLVIVLSIFAGVMAHGLMVVGVPRGPAVRTVFVWMILLTAGGRAMWALGPTIGLAIVSATAGLAAWLFRRLGDKTTARIATAVLVGFLASGILLSFFDGSRKIGTNSFVDGAPLGIQLERRPDIFLIVLDGYPGLLTFEMFGDGDKSDLLRELDARDFQTPKSAWAAYWSTEFSIPSLLELRYPFEPPTESLTTSLSSFRAIGGDNELVRTLSQHGYETFMIESGWSGSSCGALISKCVSSPFFDEGMALVLHDAVVGQQLFRVLGNPLTIGTERSMAWLQHNAGAIARDSVPSLVVAHLGIPHPPFYFNAACERVVEATRFDASFSTGSTPDQWEQYFAQQVACADRFVIDLIDRLPDDAVVVFTSDHGTGRLRQLLHHGAEWGDLHITERLNVFVSARVECEIGDQLILPNLMRRVLNCYSSHNIPDTAPRMFIPPGIEVSSETVDRLMHRTGG